MTTFKDLGLSPMIMQALEEIGFKTPTPIQSKAIPHLINSDSDLIALAQTGTGKTAAFSLPIIQQLDTKSQNVQTLVLCPTRELAIQIAKDLDKFLKYSPGINALAVFGGERIDIQINGMKRRPQIVVGTPGRVNDLIRRRVLKVEHIRWLVLDEADEMLNMGFKEEIDEILINMPKEKQVLLFSATMNKQIRSIANNYMRKPEDITVGEQNAGADNVQHFYYMVHEKDRYQALKRIADMHPDIHGIVFCRTRRETQLVADKLIQDNYSAEAIHGEISQTQRTHVMNRFREKKTQLLVATDVAARGIDVSGLTHVINYNLPESTEGYVHRSGRTGRANMDGISLVIVNMREKYKIRHLENKIGKKFEQGRIPRGEDICEKQLFSLVEKVCNISINEDQINKYLELINKKFENMDRDELLKRFISVEFNRFLEHYTGAHDLNSNVGQSEERSDKNEKYDKSGILFARFRMNVGSNLGLNIKELFDFLNANKELKGVEIGDINIGKDYTTLEADERYKDKIMDYFSRADMEDIEVQIVCEETGLKSSRGSDKKAKGRYNEGKSYGGGGGRGGQRRNSSHGQGHSGRKKRF